MRSVSIFAIFAFIIAFLSIPVFAEDTIGARERACTAIYDPVCGLDGETYSNACSAHSSGVEVAYKGQCRGVIDQVQACKDLQLESDRAACYRRIGADITNLEVPFQRCKLLQDDEARAGCYTGLKESIRDNLPAIELRKCAIIIDDRERSECKEAIVKPAVDEGRKRCDIFDDAEDKRKCLVALKEGIEESVEVKHIAYACVKQFINDEDRKAQCLKKLTAEIQNIQIDCSVYDSPDLQERCRVCSAENADTAVRASCFYRLRECREENEGEENEGGLKACLLQLKKEEKKKGECEDLGSPELKAACMREQYGLKELKRCESESGYDKTKCLNSLKAQIGEYVQYNFRRLLAAVEKLEAEGYLTEEEIATMKAYINRKAEEFKAAETGEEKREIIREVVAKWNEFKKQKIFEHHMQTIERRVETILKHIEKLEELSQKLKDAGKDTTKLDEAIANAKEHLEAVKEAETFKEMQWRLRNITLWFAHMHRILNRMRLNQPVDDVPVPTDAPKPPEEVSPTPEPSPTESATPSPTEEASPTPEPTEEPSASPTEEPSPTEAASPSPTAEPSPTPQPSPSPTAQQ